MPERLRKKHFYDYGWKSNPNAVYVGRPTKWGNPFKPQDYGLGECLMKYREWLGEQIKKDPNFLKPLVGKDLVCFCKLDAPCHADILLEMANAQIDRR